MEKMKDLEENEETHKFIFIERPTKFADGFLKQSGDAYIDPEKVEEIVSASDEVTLIYCNRGFYQTDHSLKYVKGLIGRGMDIHNRKTKIQECVGRLNLVFLEKDTRFMYARNEIPIKDRNIVNFINNFDFSLLLIDSEIDFEPNDVDRKKIKKKFLSDENQKAIKKFLKKETLN